MNRVPDDSDIEIRSHALSRGTPGPEDPAESAPDRPTDSVGPPASSNETPVAPQISPGQILGQRYSIEALLGRGGMGEVWRAFDLKLRVEVALKSIHAHLLSDRQGLELLRREVLAARQVVSPNVCRIFDLVEVDGRELVSMELVDGTTLLDLLQQEGSLDVRQATDIASQFLAGLEAIHEAGLVHRDLKPENLMVTRAGRVLVMDFGIAKAAADRPTGTVSGTPAYMAPEQARGDVVDARADVFAAGVVLAELMSADAAGDSRSRQTLWRNVHHEPPEIPEGPWAHVIRKAVAREPVARYESAGALARALDEATQRTTGADDVTPYPGLAVFTEADAEYFFGRRVEVEALWRQLAVPRLQALIGPSGTGKSSFLRAGLIPSMLEDWRAVICHPGERPFLALAQGLTPELSSDTEALRDLLRFDEPDVAVELFGRWRRQHDEVLLIVDQFEELFTLNPGEVQASFSELLSRLALEADVHVLLSMRDDFLFHCSNQSALAPIFAELTPLKILDRPQIRRVLVQPALKCGYRFEDDELVDEMVAEVEDERGALPLLAFAAASLWQRRDRERGLLTREAYRAIGGVAGAMAQHAEATLERIGRDNIPVVRELFRNLMTSHATRASRDREELLSVFGGSDASALLQAGALAPDVFLSYSRSDLDRAKRLARLLEAEGFTVWWDRHIAPGEDFDEVIERALGKARAVVVLWSQDSIDSHWVKAEASEALESDRLVPVLVDRVKPPLEFRRLQAAELYSWAGEEARQELAQLTAALRATIGQQPGRTRTRGVARTAHPAATTERETAQRVLNSLIDARLLTSYEAPAADDETRHQRIEIIHESLLTAWPRLVRWQTQDQEGAQLRDELRQAARMWAQHHRPEDLLWTGTAFREFELWRERYSGGLSDIEETFAQAMVSRAERRKRRRRMAVVAVVGLALVVAAVTGGLWLRSDAQARRAEAAKLLALAQLRSEDDPTEALAFTTASLELADTDAARVLAMKLLWEAPQAIEAGSGSTVGLGVPSFSPDAARLAASGQEEEVRLWRAEGGPPALLPGHEQHSAEQVCARWASNELLVTGLLGGYAQQVHVWRLPGRERVRTIDFGAPAWWQAGEGHLFAEVIETDAETGHEIYALRSWRLPNGEPRELGTVDRNALESDQSRFDPDGSGWVYIEGSRIFYRPLPLRGSVSDHLVGRHENAAEDRGLPAAPDRLWTRDASSGELRLWDLATSTAKPLRVVAPPSTLEPGTPLVPSLDGQWATDLVSPQGHIRLEDVPMRRQSRIWDLHAWPQARPIGLRRSGSWFGAQATFHPRGDWLVVSTHGRSRLTFWPLGRNYSRIVDGYSARFFRPVEFSPDSRWLATSWSDDSLRLWPLPGSGSHQVTTLRLPPEAAGRFWRDLAFDPQGRFLVVMGYTDIAYVVPLDGSPPRRLEAFSGETPLSGAAVSPSGRQVAAAFRIGPTGKFQRALKVWNLDTDELRRFDLPERSAVVRGWEMGVADLTFVDESTLYTSGDGGVRRWNLDTGTHELVLPSDPGSYGTWAAFGPSARTALVMDPRPGAEFLGFAHILDLATGEMRAFSALAMTTLRSPDLWPRNAFDVSAAVAASGDPEGIIRVATLSGGEPHLLPGHEGPVDYVAISPDGRWVASTGEDETLRLWPTPDLDEPPLHTLPLDELLAKLKSLTNIRVVRDPDSAEGWKVELGPFPGWQEVPAW